MNTLEIDRLLARFASHQFGLVTGGQAGAVGITRSALHVRVRARTLERVHEGVYRVCSVESSKEQGLLAACLAVPGSVLADVSAAFVHGLPIGRRFDDYQPSVLISHDRGYRSTGTVTVRRSRQVIRSQVWRSGKVSPASSTIISLAPLVSRATLARCIDHAIANRLVTVSAITREIESRSASRFAGRPILIDELAARSSGRVRHRSGKEQWVARCLRDSTLPAAKANYNASVQNEEIVEVDFAWPAARIALEVSPFYTHGSERAQRRDIERRAMLQMAGWRVVEATDEHLFDKRAFAEIIHQISALLACGVVASL